MKTQILGVFFCWELINTEIIVCQAVKHNNTQISQLKTGDRGKNRQPYEEEAFKTPVQAPGYSISLSPQSGCIKM